MPRDDASTDRIIHRTPAPEDLPGRVARIEAKVDNVERGVYQMRRDVDAERDVLVGLRVTLARLTSVLETTNDRLERSDSAWSEWRDKHEERHAEERRTRTSAVIAWLPHLVGYVAAAGAVAYAVHAT